jgi:hypothetical protein
MSPSTSERSAAISQVAGYGFGTRESARSPLSLEELRQLEQTLGWTGGDEQVLRKHAELFRSQADQMVSSWRSVIGAQPHLAQWFAGPDGKPDDEYKARVKARFVQWVIDVATRPHDQDWLDYQEEIGLRHTPDKKNKTDGRHTPPVVPLRFLLAFIPVVTDVRRFLEGRIPDADMAAVERAWIKTVHLHVTLWSRPYAREGLW